MRLFQSYPEVLQSAKLPDRKKADVERQGVFLFEQSHLSTVFPDAKLRKAKAERGISTNPQAIRRIRRVFVLFIRLAQGAGTCTYTIAMMYEDSPLGFASMSERGE